MAVLPTTGLTANFDASTMSGNVYNDVVGGVPTGSVSSGGQAGAWKSTVTADHVWRPFDSATVFRPWDITWEDDDVLGLPSIKITDGTLRAQLASSGGVLAPSTLFAAGAKSFAFSFLIEDASLLANSATPYLNSALVGHPKNGFLGTFLRNNAGTITLYAYNWDGNPDVVSFTVTEDTKYTLIVTHNGTTLDAYLTDTSGENHQSTASGNTTNLGTTLFGGESNSGGTEQVRVRLGQISMWNVQLTGTDLTDAKDYYSDKWLSTLISTPNAASSWSVPSPSVTVGDVSVTASPASSSWNPRTPTVPGSVGQSSAALFLFLP